ncbi:MAG: ABC transporter permease [Spirochaetia bacterium]|nr:ABC transporter permease [Spirochaetia bacterium]
MIPNRMTTFAYVIIILFIFIAIFSNFLSSSFPIVLWNNQSGHELPASPLLKAMFSEKEKIKLENIDFKELSRQNKISAVYTIIPYSAYEKNLEKILEAPSYGRFGNYLGTDELGRDVAARLIHGAKNSMMVGLIAVGISLVFGIIIGALAGYFGGKVDLIISRVIEIVICFPTLILIMAVLAILKPSLYKIMIVIGLTRWTGVARVIRGEFLKRKKEDFVMASRLVGASHLRLIFIHLLPNSLAPVIVMTSFGVASVVLLESGLSFLGIGIQLPEPSWGQILNTSRDYIDFAWWLTLYPGILIFLTVVSYNLLGDHLRKVFNPRER